MSSLDDELSRRLEDLDRQVLRRRLRNVESPQQPQMRVGGHDLVNFSSNDYLGLATHPRLKEALIEGTTRFGVGAGASRLICGNLEAHRELEDSLARFKATDAALTFSTGYATALGTVCSLVSQDDIVILDRLVHASIIDAARLSRATLRVFGHNDMEQLEAHLQWAEKARRKADGTAGQVLVVTESVFSMDGDLAPIRNLVELKECYGAWLMVDEAHGTGLFGTHRRGVVEAMEMTGMVEIQMGTLGKALGVSGGYIAGSRVLIDWLINRARSFIFSTAPPPAVAWAAREAVRLVESEEGESLRQQLWSRVNRVKEAVVSAGWTLPAVQSPILPILVGNEEAALKLASRLQDEGFLIPAIRYPTVPRGEARLRLTVNASHTIEQIERLGRCLQSTRADFA